MRENAGVNSGAFRANCTSRSAVDVLDDDAETIPAVVSVDAATVVLAWLIR